MNLNAKETFLVVYSVILGFVLGVLNQSDGVPRFLTLLALFIGLLLQRFVVWINWEDK